MHDDMIRPNDLRAILSFVADRIKHEEGDLNSLDSAVGDGDHGITMRIGFDAVADKLRQVETSADISSILTESGKAFMGATGGAIGILMGKMLISAGNALRGSLGIGAKELKVLLDAMEASVAKAGKVEPGDKTILDAVHGACQAISGPNGSLRSMALMAANGAEAAANETAHMLCRAGRGSKLGERVLGCPDPGAKSFSIILRAVSDWIEGQSSSITNLDRNVTSEGKA